MYNESIGRVKKYKPTAQTSPTRSSEGKLWEYSHMQAYVAPNDSQITFDVVFLFF